MTTNAHNTRRGLMLIWPLAWLMAAAGVAGLAQTPPPAQLNPAGQAGPPPAPVPGGAGQGRGGGGPAGAPDPNLVPDFTKRPPLQAKRPAEQLTQFVMQPGYRMELVLSDPVIQEPTAIAFDGNGRMFVVEDRSYMMDADMTGQLDPISRISLHVDTDNDGVYDKHTVFIDHLVFPRFVTPFGPNTILTKESNAQELWKYTDTNGDGVADKKELFDTGYGRLANIEGQEAFLTWTLDNWMYSSYNAFRARWTPHGIIKEPTAPNSAEWGVTQDNDGKIWWEAGGGRTDLIPIPDRVWLRRAGEFHDARRVRTGFPDSLGRAGSHRGHAGRAARHPHAGRLAEERDRQRGQRYLSRPSPPEGSGGGVPLWRAHRADDHLEYIVKAVLHGVTGPIDGKTYSDAMIPMGNNDDEWICVRGLLRP